MSRLSTRWACASGAVTRSIGSSRKKDRSFGHRIDITVEAPVRKILNKLWTECRLARDPLQILRREARTLEKAQDLFQSGSNEKIALRRQFAHKELEDGGLLHADVKVTLQHRQLIKVRQKNACLSAALGNHKRAA